ncbi:MAG: hypothetical protein AAF915_04885 [Cyanobacteria bacterium P01_D01_bin.50]
MLFLLLLRRLVNELFGLEKTGGTDISQEKVTTAAEIAANRLQATKKVALGDTTIKLCQILIDFNSCTR